MAATVAVAALAVGGCADDDVGGAFALDGSPRFPDDEGVVTSVVIGELELDGDRTYGMSSDLVSFSTYTMELEPVLGWDGSYVQVGLDGDTVVWIAGIADVFPSDPPSAYYTGELVEVDDDGRLIFADGTVLELADDAEVAVEEGSVVVEIDAADRRAIDVQPT